MNFDMLLSLKSDPKLMPTLLRYFLRRAVTGDGLWWRPLYFLNTLNRPSEDTPSRSFHSAIVSFMASISISSSVLTCGFGSWNVFEACKGLKFEYACEGLPRTTVLGFNLFTLACKTVSRLRSKCFPTCPATSKDIFCIS